MSIFFWRKKKDEAAANVSPQQPEPDVPVVESVQVETPVEESAPVEEPAEESAEETPAEE